MLLNMNELLKVAKEHQFAIPAFNVGSIALLNAVLEECQAQNAPVIIALHPDEHRFLGDDFAKYCVMMAKKVKIPVVVHQDHGTSLADIIMAIKCGYTSVMIDASLSAFTQNINQTKEIVNICHTNNISVEAELGTIGNNDGSFEGVSKNIIYTNPSDVVTFINETQVDSLAVAIGTAHGLYPKICNRS